MVEIFNKESRTLQYKVCDVDQIIHYPKILFKKLLSKFKTRTLQEIKVGNLKSTSQEI